MKSELISIIVPVYNLENVLARCLESILSQSYENIEVIVVDDGSTDKSANVIRAFALRDDRVKPIFQKNAGVTSARLAGVLKAQGGFIGFVDGDDEIDENMYERLLKNARDFDCQISHCGFRMIFPDGRVNFFHNSGILEEQNRETLLRELLLGKKLEPSLCNKLFRRELFDSLFLKRDMLEKIKINEDLLINFFLFSAAKKAVFEDFCPYCYIVRSGSASRKKADEHKIFDPIKVKRIIIENADEAIKKNAVAAYLNTCINCAHCVFCGGKEYRKELETIRSLLKKEKSNLSLLSKKRKIIANLIVYAPKLYGVIYRIYSNKFQKSIYS